jgi:hypothetical protein
VANYERFGVAYSEEQAKGIQAFCELSQILPIFNEGWESDFGDGKMKWFHIDLIIFNIIRQCLKRFY